MLFTSRVVSRIVVRKECCTLERVNIPHINANQKDKDDDPARPITKYRLISLDTNNNDRQEKEAEAEEEEENQYRSSSTVTSSILLLLLLPLLLLLLS